MTVFPAADPAIHSIFSQSMARLLSAQAPGEESFLCGHCDEAVCENINPVQLQGFVYQCEACGGYCILPRQFEIPRNETAECPPRIRAVAHSRTASSLLSKLDEAIEWLASLGFNVQNTRVASYRSILNSVLESNREAGAGSRLAIEYINSYFEANEICGIYEAFSSGEYDEYLRLRLKTLCGGPVFLSDENTSSGNAARNYAFELQTAANFVLGGLDLEFDDESDVVICIDGRKVVLECKRPYREKGCGKRFSEANRQLQNRYRGDVSKNVRGIIVLDLTRVAGLDLTSPINFTFEEAAEMRTSYFKAFTAQYSSLIRKLSGSQTIGILLRISLIGRLTDYGGFVYMQDHSFVLVPGTFPRDQQTFFAVASVLRKRLSRKESDTQIAVVEEYSMPSK